MTLAEIETLVDKANEAEPERWWDVLPRIVYSELPSVYKKYVRDHYTPERLLTFIDEEYKTITEDPGTKLPEIFNSLPEDKQNAIIIRARNTAVYIICVDEHIKRIDQSTKFAEMFVPTLFASDFLKAFADAYIDITQPQINRAANARKRASSADPIMKTALPLANCGHYQIVISDKDHQQALTAKYNETAYLAVMDPEFFSKLDFTNGTITYDNEIAGIIKTYRRGSYEDIQNIDFPLLVQLYTAAVKSNIRRDKYTITASIPQFFAEMGIDIKAGNAQDVLKKLHSFENCVGIMRERRTVSKLFSIIQIDFKNNIITFAMPYVLELFDSLEEHNRIEKKTRNGLIEYQKPSNNMLCHSTLVKERNKSAVQLVYLITSGLLRRGSTPTNETYRKKNTITAHPERREYSTSFRNLIQMEPVLHSRLKSYKSDRDRNIALSRAFSKAFQLIRTKTDAPLYFLNLQYTDIVPTMQTLDDLFVATFTGINGDYKPKTS